ncbi:MAG: NAD(P)H-dependent oxidoreductase [Phycisphaerae bacterium]|nr:NAD(P)H-dependent oxidoreductase [Phycisphaerae bacterium]
MQVLITYYSRTGNTKRLADEVALGVRQVQGVTCLVKPVSEVAKEDFLASDAVIAGSPVYFGTMAADLKRLFDEFVGLRRKMADKIGAAFVTSGHPTGGKETALLSILEAFLIYGMIVVGDPLEASGHYGVACVGAPDQTTCQDAAKLGKRVAGLVKRLHG